MIEILEEDGKTTLGFLPAAGRSLGAEAYLTMDFGTDELTARLIKQSGELGWAGNRLKQLEIATLAGRVFAAGFHAGPVEMVAAALGDDLRKQGVVVEPALSQEELASLGKFGELLSKPSKEPRRIFDYRTLPESVAALDTVILNVLFHPEVEYNLLAVATSDERESFLNRVKEYVRNTYKRELPQNFQLHTVDSEEQIVSRVNTLVSEQMNVPAAFISEKKDIAGEPYRRNLVQVEGSQDSLLQNTAVVLMAEKLLEESWIQRFYYQILTLSDLTADTIWAELLASIEARQQIALPEGEGIRHFYTSVIIQHVTN